MHCSEVGEVAIEVELVRHHSEPSLLEEGWGGLDRCGGKARGLQISETLSTDP